MFHRVQPVPGVSCGQSTGMELSEYAEGRGTCMMANVSSTVHTKSGFNASSSISATYMIDFLHGAWVYHPLLEWVFLTFIDIAASSKV